MADVGCAGLLVEDVFCGPVAALPAPGALVLLDAMPVRAGGCAANVAIDLARQGIGVEVAGCVGPDSAAAMLRATFDRYGISDSSVAELAEEATSRTVILLIDGDDRRYFHTAGANSRFGVEHIPPEWLKRLKIFYLGGLFALPNIDLGALAGLLRFCREAGVRTVVDVVVPQHHGGMDGLGPLLPLIDMFVPNEDEARAFTGLTDPRDQIDAFREAGAASVIITRGQSGSIGSDASGVYSCGSYAMDVIDPSGSGDAFTSGIIRGMLDGWELPHMLRYASAIGASATRATGTTDSVFNAAEAEEFLEQHPLRVIHES